MPAMMRGPGRRGGSDGSGLQHLSRDGRVGRVAQPGCGQVVGASSQAVPAEQPHPVAGRPPARAAQPHGRRRHRPVREPRRRGVLGADRRGRGLPDDLVAAVDPTDPKPSLPGRGRPASIARATADGSGRTGSTSPRESAPSARRSSPAYSSTPTSGARSGPASRSTASFAAWTAATRGRAGAGIDDLDVHDVTIARTQPARVASTNGEVFWSADRGETWTPDQSEMAIAVCPRHRGEDRRPGVLFAGCGETTTGETGPCSAPGISGRLGEPAAARPAQRHDVGPGDPSRRREPHRRVDPLRRGLRHRGRRGVLAQDRAGVRRDQGRGLGAKLIFIEENWERRLDQRWPAAAPPR